METNQREQCRKRLGEIDRIFENEKWKNVVRPPQMQGHGSIH